MNISSLQILFLVLLISTTAHCWERIVLKNQGTSRCLDSNAQGHVYAIHCNGGDHQEWVVEADRSLMNLATKRCLDSNGKVLYALPCNGGEYQKWGTSHVHLKNEGTGLCVEGTDYSNDVTVSPCSTEGKYQLWGTPGPDLFKDEL